MLIFAMVIIIIFSAIADYYYYIYYMHYSGAHFRMNIAPFSSAAHAHVSQNFGLKLHFWEIAQKKKKNWRFLKKI